MHLFITFSLTVFDCEEYSMPYFSKHVFFDLSFTSVDCSENSTPYFSKQVLLLFSFLLNSTQSLQNAFIPFL